MKAKNIFSPVRLGLLAASGAALVTGCATARKQADVTHDLIDRAAVTNGSRTVIYIAHEEHWRDRHIVGTRTLLVDPSAEQVSGTYSNQNALGGASEMSVGKISAIVNTNAISAVGTAAGNVIQGVGEAVKAAR